MKKKCILYIMSIEWEWIYQRPQIFAEKLGRDYDVTVVFPRYVWQGRLKENKTSSGLQLRPLWRLPYQERSGMIRVVSDFLNKPVFRDINDFDYIYIGYPLYARYIPQSYKGKIIYDCMDNYEALFPLRNHVGKIVAAEEKLVARSDMLFVSSEVLRRKMDRIAGCAKSILVRNGLFLTHTMDIKPAQSKTVYDIGYVGTISKWFDWELITASATKMNQIRYQLIGPCEESVEHERIQYHGSMAHEELADAVRDYDCLVMPFCLNEIVEAVDPVKLYEYISYGKCIISIYYPEIERFSEFVYFYQSPKEYYELLDRLCREGFPPKYNKEQQRRFLEDNTWDRRYQVLDGSLKSLE